MGRGKPRRLDTVRTYPIYRNIQVLAVPHTWFHAGAPDAPDDPGVLATFRLVEVSGGTRLTSNNVAEEMNAKTFTLHVRSWASSRRNCEPTSVMRLLNTYGMRMSHRTN